MWKKKKNIFYILLTASDNIPIMSLKVRANNRAGIKQRQAATDRDRQRQTGTGRNRHGQTGTGRDRQELARTMQEQAVAKQILVRQCQCVVCFCHCFVLAYSCFFGVSALSLLATVFSFFVPVLSLVLMSTIVISPTVFSVPSTSSGQGHSWWPLNF